MANGESSAPTRLPLPIILIRGFGGLSVDEERQLTYQGFNDGSVYPRRRGENFIYEGFILKLIKTDYAYGDATNVVTYFADMAPDPTPASIADFGPDWRPFFTNDRIVADPDLTRRLRSDPERMAKTFWVFRYYDLEDRTFTYYGKALERLINMVREVCRPADAPEGPKVNIVAHSMGGLIVREAIQSPEREAAWAERSINKIVTLGTPHRGISFQLLRDLRWLPFLEAGPELERFNPETQGDENNPTGYKNFGQRFPLERLLCVVGTDYRSYSIRASSLANRVFSVQGEFGLNYNRSDGLVKQTNAQIPRAGRTFVHKPHGGGNSLMTARESFEVATRFFFGDIRVRVRLVSAAVKRRLDIIGRSEIFFGLKVKPRRLDFDLFNQSVEAENCYGPFAERDLSDVGVAFDWADDNRLIWEGYLNSLLRQDPDIVMRAEIYVGERDLLGFGFSDNLIFQKQYFVRALVDPALRLEWHVNQDFQAPGAPDTPASQRMREVAEGWQFPIGEEDSFDGVLGIELAWVPETGHPIPLVPGSELQLEPPAHPGAAFKIVGVRQPQN